MEPIIQVAMSSICSLIALFILTKLLGYRQMSQLSMFDYVSGITMGSITAEMATALDKDWVKPLIAMIIYTLVSLIIAITTNKSVSLRRLLTGKTLVLLDKGQIYYEHLKKAKMDVSELLVQCRQKGFFDLSYIEMVVLEPNGQLSILPKSMYRPLTAYDSKLKVDKERPVANLVIDGKILKENLENIGKDEAWLMEMLSKKGIHKLSEAFLVTCNKKYQLSVYQKIKESHYKDIL